MFLRSSTRPQAVDCFFCLSPSLLPPARPETITRDWKGKSKAIPSSEVGTKWNWHCERCGCWNVRDERGEIVSELPAMRTPSMNSRSFEFRAKPSTSHLPSSLAASPFCHICLTNQTLIMNMLANYLPDENDPTYPALYHNLPAYLASVHTRYPPVCANCQPAVDEALRKANHRANVDAWGSALRRGNDEAESSSTGGEWAQMLDVAFWRLRGIMFISSSVLSLGMGVTSIARPGLLQSQLERRFFGVGTPVVLLLYHAISVGWMAWDPYWLRRKRNRSRVRVRGRGIWLRDMIAIYGLRLTTAIWNWYRSTQMPTERSLPFTFIQVACAAELILFFHALMSLKITAPVTTRPIQPVTLSVPPTPTPHSQFPRHALDPNVSAGRDIPNPMFGLPSFASSSASDEKQLGDYEPMDWEPSPSVNRSGRSKPPGLDDDEYDSTPRKNDWDNFAVNKQRMFGKSEHDETGLESLIAGWGIDTGASNSRSPDVKPSMQHRISSHATPLSPSRMSIGELLVRVTSCILVIARIAALGAYLAGLGLFTEEKIDTIDKILSGVEVGTIVMSAIMLPRTYPSPRIAILAGDLILHMVYAVFQRQAGPLEIAPREPWMLGMTWGQWALLSATRVLL